MTTTTITHQGEIITTDTETMDRLARMVRADGVSSSTFAADADSDRYCVSGDDPDAPAVIPEDGDFADESFFLDASHPTSEHRFSHIVAGLIRDDPDRLGHLQTATFRCLWQRVGAKECGVPVLGKASRPGKLQRWLAGEVDFFLVLAADSCLATAMTHWQLEARLYNLLCACDLDPDTAKPSIRPAEFSGYVAEIARYGFHSVSLTRAKESFRQLSLSEQE